MVSIKQEEALLNPVIIMNKEGIVRKETSRALSNRRLSKGFIGLFRKNSRLGIL